jgi:thymidylate synthase (FAD)
MMKVELVDKMGTDLTTVNTARVSFKKAKKQIDEKDKKLILYLAKHNHWAPFAHATIQFRVSAPIFVARQLAKHQVGAVWSEESRRYVDDEPDIYVPGVWRGRAENVKQGSGDNLHPGDGYLANSTYDAAMRDAALAYQNLLKRGVAPEMARMCLPQSAVTEWIWTGSLLFFSRVCQLRLEGHAQSETRVVAEKIHDICAILFPLSWAALMSRQDPPAPDEAAALKIEVESLRKALDKANGENSKILQRLHNERIKKTVPSDGLTNPFLGAMRPKGLSK